MKLTIDRKVWLRGEGDADDPNFDTRLLRASDGKRCCVGIYLSALGVSDEALRDEREACNLGMKQVPKAARWLVRDGDGCTDNSQAGMDLYDINDSKEHRGAIRERKVAKAFAVHGVEVEFVG